jgi:hypothetical protein
MSLPEIQGVKWPERPHTLDMAQRFRPALITARDHYALALEAERAVLRKVLEIARRKAAAARTRGNTAGAQAFEEAARVIGDTLDDPR